MVYSLKATELEVVQMFDKMACRPSVMYYKFS